MIRCMCAIVLMSAGVVGCASECVKSVSDVTVEPGAGPKVSWTGQAATNISFWQAESEDSTILVVELTCTDGTACIPSPYVYGDVPDGAVAEPAEFPELAAGEAFEVTVDTVLEDDTTCSDGSERFPL